MTEFKVTGMSCSHCVSAITAAVRRHAPEAAVDVDLAAGRVRVGSTVDPGTLLQAIEDAGYHAELVQAMA